MAQIVGRRGNATLALVLGLFLAPAAAEAQSNLQSPAPTPAAAANPSDAEAGRLSIPALESLVAGVALYPDPVIEQVLAAAQHPQAIVAAASPTASPAATPESVQALRQYPELLGQLSQNMALTTRLGLAARMQLADVWQAVDAVRLKVDDVASAANAGAEDDGLYEDGVYVAGAYPYAWAAGRVTRSLLAAHHWREWHHGDVPTAALRAEGALGVGRVGIQNNFARSTDVALAPRTRELIDSRYSAVTPESLAIGHQALSQGWGALNAVLEPTRAGDRQGAAQPRPGATQRPAPTQRSALQEGRAHATPNAAPGPAGPGGDRQSFSRQEAMQRKLSEQRPGGPDFSRTPGPDFDGSIRSQNFGGPSYGGQNLGGGRPNPQLRKPPANFGGRGVRGGRR